jgi:hypothetical protein
MQKVYVKAIEILPAVNAVGKDADECEVLMATNDTQFARRNWVRAYFAWVEAMCFLLRRFVIEKKFQKRVIRPADIPEFSALSEIKYSVTPKGEAVAEPANSKTRDYIGFSLMACSRLFGLGLSIDRGSKHFQNFDLALRVRDRITHPKTLAEITISNDDVKAVKEFKGWFAAHIEVLFNEGIKAKMKKEVGIAKRTKKTRTLVFDESNSSIKG